MSKKSVLLRGMRDGIPIGLGYFAVAVALGITAREIGFTPFQALLCSALNNASAGEYAAFRVIGAGGTYLEVAVMTLVANARYLLMSCALSQKLEPSASTLQRMIVGFDVTDEIFGISMSYEGRVSPYYPIGAMIVAIPGWAVGTMVGVMLGNIMPSRLVSALSVALFGMFIAVIIPPARKSRIIAVLVVASMALSALMSCVTWFSFLSSGTQVIVLTVVISATAALLFPVKDEKEAEA